MKQLLFCLILSALCLPVFAQNAVGHDLTVWSDEGLNFTLYFNGQKMNETPTANLVCNNVMQDYVHAVVKFEDTSIPDIERKIFQIKMNSNYQLFTTVYKITQKKNGRDFKWVSSNEKVYVPNQTVIIQNNPPQPQGNNIRISTGGVEINATIPPHK